MSPPVATGNCFHPENMLRAEQKDKKKQHKQKCKCFLHKKAETNQNQVLFTKICFRKVFVNVNRCCQVIIRQGNGKTLNKEKCPEVEKLILKHS